MKQLSEQEALNKAAAYCTQCERCTSEVMAKLTAWGMDYARQERIIGTLIEEVIDIQIIGIFCFMGIFFLKCIELPDQRMPLRL